MRFRPLLFVPRTLVCLFLLPAAESRLAKGTGLPWLQAAPIKTASAAQGHVAAANGEATKAGSFGLPSASGRALAAERRLGAEEAGDMVRKGACAAVYDDDDGAFWRCLGWLEHLEPVPMPIAYEELAPVDPSLVAAERACQQDGFLAVRLPACIDALALYLEATRDGDDALAESVIALGNRTCHPTVLCLP